MGVMHFILLAAAVTSSPLGPLVDTDPVVTNVDLSESMKIDRSSRELYEYGDTNRVSIDSVPVTTGSVKSVVSYNGASRMNVAMSRTGAQTYVYPDENSFVWVPEDANLRFGGTRNADGSVTGTRTVGARIRTSIDAATNGLVSLSSSEWLAITNKLATFRQTDISMDAVDGEYLYSYSIRADGRVDKIVDWVHEVSRSATSQGVITVEYPMYLFRRGPATSGNMTSGTWKGPYYKKVAGELKWEYDSEKTQTDLVGYDSSGNVSSYVRNYYFNYNYYKSYASAYSFGYSTGPTLCAISPYNQNWWIGTQYSKGAYMPLGGSVSFIDAVKGTNSEEYVGYGDLAYPNVQAWYEDSKWYLDRSVGSGEYLSFIGNIPYTYTGIVTNRVESYILKTVTSDEDLRFIVGTNGLSYVRSEFGGLDTPWHLDLSYVDDTRLVSVDLPYRGRNDDGDYVWSYHDDSSKWVGNYSNEWGTVLWDVSEETWVFTGGFGPWYVPVGGAISGVYNMNSLGASSVPYPQGYENYPCTELSFTGRVTVESRFSYETEPEFFGKYTRNVSIGYHSVTNSISGSVDVDELSKSFVPRNVTTNGNVYVARPRLLNGNIIMVYEK